ncbi:MAG: hypothetical protein H6732_11195 [Alphaproteobacteria bacterium]|nr:hypothetical protein [Alphaproteobacteria bacterium]
MPSGPSPRPPRWTADRLLAGWLLLLAVLSFLDRLAVRDTELTEWTDRDLLRAQGPLSSLEPMGAELSYGVGARIPGGAEALVLWPVERLLGDTLAALRWVTLIEGAGVALLGWLAWRLRGPLAGALTVLVASWLALGLATSRVLWNPSLVAPLVGAALAAAVWAVHRRDGRWLVPMGLALGLAGQMHLGAWLAGAGLWAGVAVARPPGWVRGTVGGALAAAATLLPYLLHELGTDFANTRLFAHQHVGATGGSAGEAWEDLTHLLTLVGAPYGGSTLEGGPTRWGWPGLGRPLVVLGVLGAGAAGVRRLRGSTPRDGLAGLLLLPALAVVGWLLWDTSMGLRAPNEARYAVSLVPVLALGLGLGTAHLLARVQGVARAVLVGWLVAATGAEAVGLGLVFRQETRDIRSLTWTRTLLDDVEQTQGWDVEEAARRTFVTGGHEPTIVPVHHLLRRRGATFGGSARPPCLVVLPDGGGLVRRGLELGAVAEERMAAWVAAPRALAAELVRGRGLVRYDPGEDRCPTSLAQRYVRLPTEELLLASAPTWEVGVAQAVGAPARRLWGVRLHDRPPADPGGRDALVLGVEVLDGDEGPEAVLHGDALRGKSYNDGFLRSARVRAPHLRLTGEGGEVRRVDLAQGVVGFPGAATPLVTPLPEASGRWTATLVLEVLPVEGDAGAVVEVALGEVAL